MNTSSDSLALTFTTYSAQSFTEEFTYTESDTHTESFGNVDGNSFVYAPSFCGILFAHGTNFYLS